MTTMKLEGAAELERALRNGGKLNDRALNNALKAGGRVIARHARQNVPRRSGNLRRAITVRNAPAAFKAGGQAHVVVGFRANVAWYAHLVEFGTAPHTIRARGGGVLRIGGVIVGRAVRHPGARAKPFMRPALDAQGAAAIKAIGQRLYAEILKAAGVSQ